MHSSELKNDLKLLELDDGEEDVGEEHVDGEVAPEEVHFARHDFGVERVDADGDEEEEGGDRHEVREELELGRVAGRRARVGADR